MSLQRYALLSQVRGRPPEGWDTDRGARDGQVGDVHDLLALPRDLHFLLGVQVVLEDICEWNFAVSDVQQVVAQEGEGITDQGVDG